MFSQIFGYGSIHWQVSKLALASLLVFMLTACGFQMRGSYAVPASMQFICLQQGDKYELGKQLEKRLKHSNVSLINDTNSCVTLRIVNDKIERPVLSLFPNAQVAEYELNYQVNYTIQFPDQEARPFSVQVARDYQDDPEAVLAKSKEMKILLKELRRHAAEQIVLQLASLENR